MIYFDHAATSFPKPEAVYVAHDEYFRAAGNPGRGAHELSLSSARKIFESRANVAEFLGITDVERLIFTSSCTHSINAVIKGFGLKSGDCVLTTALEHNAVMRPLKAMEQAVGIRLKQLPYANQQIISSDDLVTALERERPKLCVFTDASNVTGERVQSASVAAICAKFETSLLIDAAQTAGSEPGCLKHAAGITFWAAPGHKGLLGAPGVGLLYLRESAKLNPLIDGGTGSGSESLEMPVQFPDRLEAGTQAGSAIAALGAGAKFIADYDAQKMHAQQMELANVFRIWCLERDWICVHGKSYGASERDVSEVSAVPIVSFSLDTRRADEVADILNTRFDIAVRAGLHCAALAHKTLGTLKTGAVRASFGYANTIDEVESLCDALEIIRKI